VLTNIDKFTNKWYIVYILLFPDTLEVGHMSQNVPFGRLYIEAAMLHYRNQPRKDGFGAVVFDALFLFYAVVTVLGSGFRFLDKHPYELFGLPFDSTLVRVLVALAVGYASLVQSVWLFKLVGWMLRKK
jgi:hypothetical protein